MLDVKLTHDDSIRCGLMRLEVRRYSDGYTAFEVVLVVDKSTFTLDYMPLHENPDMGDLYDFDSNQWVLSELSYFWDELTVDLDKGIDEWERLWH